MMVNQVVRAEKLDPVVETIFQWRQGDPSHCLLRVFKDEQEGQVVIALSELASNDGNLTVARELHNLVSTVENWLASTMDLDPEQTLWLLHYGRFSQVPTFENQYDSELFRQFQFDWSAGELVPVGQEKVLFRKEVEQMFPQMALSLGEGIEMEQYSSTVLNG